MFESEKKYTKDGKFLIFSILKEEKLVATFPFKIIDFLWLLSDLIL